MSNQRKKDIESVMQHTAVSRRRFTRKLAGAAFAVPAIMSFSLDEVAFGATSTNAQTIFPSHPSTVQSSMSSPAVRYYCVPADPSRRVFSPLVPSQ
jgi:hypothetical protein